jgi:hypothetical protein
MDDINKRSGESPSGVKNVLSDCKDQAVDMAMGGSKQLKPRLRLTRWHMRIMDELPDEIVAQLLDEIGDVNESTYRRGYCQGDYKATGRFSQELYEWRLKNHHGLEVTPFTIAESPPNPLHPYRSTVIERLSMETHRDRWPLLTELINRYRRY